MFVKFINFIALSRSSQVVTQTLSEDVLTLYPRRSPSASVRRCLRLRHQFSGGVSQAFGARMRNTCATVGATWSIVTGVRTFSACNPPPIRKSGKPI